MNQHISYQCFFLNYVCLLFWSITYGDVFYCLFGMALFVWSIFKHIRNQIVHIHFIVCHVLNTHLPSILSDKSRPASSCQSRKPQPPNTRKLCTTFRRQTKNRVCIARSTYITCPPTPNPPKMWTSFVNYADVGVCLRCYLFHASICLTCVVPHNVAAAANVDLRHPPPPPPSPPDGVTVRLCELRPRVAGAEELRPNCMGAD